MTPERADVFASPDTFHEYCAQIEVRLRSRRAERHAFLQRAIAELETLLRTAESVADEEARRDLRAKLETARQELHSLAEPGAEAEPLPDASATPSLAGPWSPAANHTAAPPAPATEEPVAVVSAGGAPAMLVPPGLALTQRFFPGPTPSPPPASQSRGLRLDWDLDLSARAGQEPADRPVTPGPPLHLEISIGRLLLHRTLQGGQALLGRRDPARGIFPEIDLSQDDAVSRRHARISCHGGQYYLVDLDSTNGTVVNEQEIPPQVALQLQPGDEIRIGEKTRIRVRA